MGPAPPARREVSTHLVTIDGYLAYLRDVRRMSPNTVESYARDLAALAALPPTRSIDAISKRSCAS